MRPSMREARLEAITRVCPHCRTRLLRQASDLSPESVICKVVPSVSSSLPQESTLSTCQDFFVTRPWLEGAAFQTTNFQSQVGIREYWRVERSAVCASRPCA